MIEMTPETVRALRAISEAVQADMPSHVARAYHQILERLTAEIGESPEAWRGAIVVCGEVITAYKTLLAPDGDHDIGELAAAAAAGITMIVTDLLTSELAQLVTREGEL